MHVVHQYKYSLHVGLSNYVIHHAVLQGTVLCGATLHLPEVKSCRIIGMSFKESSLLKIVVIYSVLSSSKDLELSMQFMQDKTF